MWTVLEALARALVAGGLLVLPGAWIAFARPLERVSRPVLLATACALSPLVVYGEFYALRLSGVGFAATAWTIAVANLFALERVRRRWSPAPRQPEGSAFPVVAAHAAPFALIALPALLQPDHRAWLAHSWLQSAPVYFLAAGQLAPEESELAGVVACYPWTGHVHQGLISFVADAPPATSYLWTNLAWLAVVSAFVVAFVRRLGGGTSAKVAALIALWFGVNALGYLLRQATELEPQGPVTTFGDPRYTPWLWKFRFFQQTTMGLGTSAALAYWLARAWRPDRRTAAEWTVLASLMLALGFAYPILVPPIAGLIAAVAVLALAPAVRRRLGVGPRRAGAVLGLLAACGAAAYANFAWVTSDRVAELGRASPWGYALRKGFEALVVTSVLLVPAAAVLRRALPRSRLDAAVLGLLALSSLALYAGCDLQGGRIEYKFMYVAALALAPLAGVGLESWLRRIRPVVPSLAVASVLVLATPFVRRVSLAWHTPDGPLPRLDLGGFRLALDAAEPLAPACEALRESTPPDTVVLADSTDVDLPALVARPMYAPSIDGARIHPGVALTMPYLLGTVRGYDPALIEERRRERDALFGASDADRGAALSAALELGRPVAILVDRQRNGALAAWLASLGSASRILQSTDYEVWLVRSTPEAAVDALADRTPR
jgi:hypothetical protein